MFGAIDLTANRARPCWFAPFTRGNSPPMTTYWLLPSTVQAAWAWPVNVPMAIVGSQCNCRARGRPLNLPPTFTAPEGSG